MADIGGGIHSAVAANDLSHCLDPASLAKCGREAKKRCRGAKISAHNLCRCRRGPSNLAEFQPTGTIRVNASFLDGPYGPLEALVLPANWGFSISPQKKEIPHWIGIEFKEAGKSLRARSKRRGVSSPMTTSRQSMADVTNSKAKSK